MKNVECESETRFRGMLPTVNSGDHLFQQIVTFASGHAKFNQFDSPTHQTLIFLLKPGWNVLSGDSETLRLPRK